jgi:hypothetical protein
MKPAKSDEGAGWKIALPAPGNQMVIIVNDAGREPALDDLTYFLREAAQLDARSQFGARI